MSDVYSPFKIVHHPDKLDSLRNGEVPVPLQVQLVPTNECFFSCQYCAYRIFGALSSSNFNPHDFLEFERLLFLVKDMADMGVKAIHITGGGEPLLYPKISEVFNYIARCGVELALVTNGVRLGEEVVDSLGSALWVRVSVDL